MFRPLSWAILRRTWIKILVAELIINVNNIYTWGNVLKSDNLENKTDWRISLRWIIRRQIAKMRYGWNLPISCHVDQWFSTFVRPLFGKFFSYKTRARYWAAAQRLRNTAVESSVFNGVEDVDSDTRELVGTIYLRLTPKIFSPGPQIPQIFLSTLLYSASGGDSNFSPYFRILRNSYVRPKLI
jgi:hypothetical protein